MMTTAGNPPCFIDKIAKYFSVFFFVFSLFVTIVTGKWALWDSSPSTVNYHHPVLLERPVNQLEEITLDIEARDVTRGMRYYRFVDYCTTAKIPGRVVTFFIDGITFNGPSRPTISRPGCFKRSFPVDIPATLPVGKYQYQVHIEYKLNPIKYVISNHQKYDINVVD